MNYIIRLIDQGYLNRLLVSSDTVMETRLMAYGGPGYARIPGNVTPWMRVKGISDDTINAITVENPKRALTFATT